MIGMSCPSSFCKSSRLFSIWVDRSSEDSIAPMTAPTNSLCRSGLAENWARGVVACLLLQRFAFPQPVLDVGDDVGDAGLGVLQRTAALREEVTTKRRRRRRGSGSCRCAPQITPGGRGASSWNPVVMLTVCYR